MPGGLVEKLRQGRVLVHNWHALSWETEEQIAKKKSVDKRGAKSDEAYVREVLGEMAAARNILVINDEAHHAWRVPADSKVQGVSKAEIEEATKWIGGIGPHPSCPGNSGLPRLHATPFVPSGKQSTEEALFEWIVSDFGLNDAIESGLVKTPRVVVRDDGQLTADYKSRLYHIYNDPEVKDDLNRKAEEQEPLPDLVTNGYYLLGKDWLETPKKWQKAGSQDSAGDDHRRQPHRDRRPGEVRLRPWEDPHRRVACPERTLHIDSKVLEKAESQVDAAELNGHGDDEREDESRYPGQEADQGPTGRVAAADGGHGWPDRRARGTNPECHLRGHAVRRLGCQDRDPHHGAAGVLQPVALRAGGGARAAADFLRSRSRRRGCSRPEYVNIFGVPFTFLPHEGGDGTPPPPPTHKTQIEPVAEKRQFEITWPNVIRVDHVYTPGPDCSTWKRCRSLEIDAMETATLAELAPVIEGKPDVTRITEIDLEELGRKFRMQKIVFEAARDVYDQMKPSWKGNREFLLAQLIGLVEKFIKSDRIQISPPLFNPG